MFRYIIILFFCIVSFLFSGIKNVSFSTFPSSTSTSIHISDNMFNVDKKIYITDSEKNADNVVFIDSNNIEIQKYVIALLSMEKHNINKSSIYTTLVKYNADHIVYFSNIEVISDQSYYITDSKNNADIVIITDRFFYSSLTYK